MKKICLLIDSFCSNFLCVGCNIGCGGRRKRKEFCGRSRSLCRRCWTEPERKQSVVWGFDENDSTRFLQAALNFWCEKTHH